MPVACACSSWASSGMEEKMAVPKFDVYLASVSTCKPEAAAAPMALPSWSSSARAKVTHSPLSSNRIGRGWPTNLTAPPLLDAPAFRRMGVELELTLCDGKPPTGEDPVPVEGVMSMPLALTDGQSSSISVQAVSDRESSSSSSLRFRLGVSAMAASSATTEGSATLSRSPPLISTRSPLGTGRGTANARPSFPPNGFMLSVACTPIPVLVMVTVSPSCSMRVVLNSEASWPLLLSQQWLRMSAAHGRLFGSFSRVSLMNSRASSVRHSGIADSAKMSRVREASSSGYG
mmetsp:Transcript_130563/g.325766  ORF Transcript_130563/g.325766 Transcript_130563/m.325766 type:complete len:289 (+) Transcript_130563:530-1396(+)